MLHPTTLVKTKQDGVVRVSHLMPGHIIYSPEGERVVMGVTKHWRGRVKVVLKLSTQIWVVFDFEQCFFISKNVMRAGVDLSAGDEIVTINGLRKVEKVGYMEDKGPVYLIATTALQHQMYLDNGILVGWQNVRRRI